MLEVVQVVDMSCDWEERWKWEEVKPWAFNSWWARFFCPFCLRISLAKFFLSLLKCLFKLLIHHRLPLFLTCWTSILELSLYVSFCLISVSTSVRSAQSLMSFRSWLAFFRLHMLHHRLCLLADWSSGCWTDYGLVLACHRLTDMAL